MGRPRQLDRKSRFVRRLFCSGASGVGTLLLLLSSRCSPIQRNFGTSEDLGDAATPSIAAGEQCGEIGLSTCAGPSQQQRLICDNGVYRPDVACPAGKNCDQISGSCLSIVPECAGKSVGTRFCAATGGVRVCGLDLVRIESEPCEGTCIDGNCVTPSCGDGVTTAPEQCDDGNLRNGDGCTSDCMLATCGNGVAEAPEECDDGNTSDTDACADCRVARCGDGLVGPGEMCDDGNAEGNDACSNVCM